MICDYFRVIGAHDTVLGYADSFSFFFLHDDNIQEFDIKMGRRFYCPRGRFRPMITNQESLYKSGTRESTQLKTVLELYDMEIDQQISVPNNQKLKTMTKRRRSEASIANLFVPGKGKSKQEKWSRFQTDCMALKEEKVFVTSAKKKASVRKETVAVSATNPKIVRKKKARPHFRHALFEPTVSRGGRSVCRKRSIRDISKHGSILRQPCRCYLRG